MNLFASERSVYATVTSANLTLEEYAKAAQVGESVGFQRSWLESEEQDLTEEYYLVRDICQFFDSLAEDENYITGRDTADYIEETLATLEWLDEYESEVSSTDMDRNTRFLHNLDTPILQQALDTLGKVEVTQVYAPFYGSASVMGDILSAIDPDRAELIVESESTTLDIEELPETLDTPFDIREMEHTTTRWVHGKFLTFRGQWGTACLYGSPNLTSTALLQNSTSGNCEAALLNVFPGEQSPLDGTLFGNEAFEFSLSDPVENLESLSVRERSYEGWEALQDADKTKVRLLDARLTQPDADDVSELILRLEGISGTRQLEIQTERDSVSKHIEEDVTDGELSILIEDKQSRKNWASAVVTVCLSDEGIKSNPRRINEETQAYFREYREITQSDGTQSSTTLLKEVLLNPDTAAINVFDVALSELRELSSSQSADTPSEQDSNSKFEERSAVKLTGGSSSTPSIHTLIDRQLEYQLEQAEDALDFEDIPTPNEVESFQTHLQTFFETMELCLMLDLMEELDNKNVLAVCQDQFKTFLDLHSQFTTSISRLSDLIDDNERVKDAFVGNKDTDAQDLEFWGEAFDLLYIHPAIILELDYKSVDPVIRSHSQFVNRLKQSLESSAPALWGYIFDLTYLKDTIDSHTQDLLVRYTEEDPSIKITGEAVRTIVLYILVQRAQSNPDFLQGLANHPRYGEEAICNLARFALASEESLFDLEIVSQQQWTIVLKRGREAVESFAEEDM